MGKLHTLKLLWLERKRVEEWFWYYRSGPRGGSSIRRAIRATLENPPVADRWLRDELDIPQEFQSTERHSRTTGGQDE